MAKRRDFGEITPLRYEYTFGIDSSDATYQIAMQAGRVVDGAEFAIGGWNQGSLVRTDRGWRIAHVVLNATWRRRDESIMATVVERSIKRS
jgi:hypothetical protein